MCAAPAWLETLLDDERLGVRMLFRLHNRGDQDLAGVLPVFSIRRRLYRSRGDCDMAS